MKTLGGLFLFSLLSTGAALQCETCSGPNCTGRLETCAAGQDTCFVAASGFKLAGMTTPTAMKGCLSSTICNMGPGYLNSGCTAERVTVVCCQGESCKRAAPQVPPDIVKTNGKRCPACYTLGSKCPEEVVNCRGPQDYCFNAFVRPAHSPVSNGTLKGCINKAFCKAIKNKHLNITTFGPSLVNMKCVPAKKHSP